MLTNWSYWINTFAPGQGGGASELISQSWKIGGEIGFGLWILAIAILLIAAIARPAAKWISSNIGAKEGEKKTLKSISLDIIWYILGCVVAAVLIAVIIPVIFKVESSGGGITGGPYFSGLNTFF